MDNPESTSPPDRDRSADVARYAADFRPVKCSCGGEKFREIVKEHIDGTVCEFEVRCIKCGALTGYWAYGYYDPSFANAPCAGSATTTTEERKA